MINQSSRHPALSWGARFLTIVITSLLLTTGCFQAPQQGQPGGEAPAVVTIWHTLQGSEAAALQSQVQEIMKANPAVIIKLTYIPEQSFVNMTYQAEAGGEGPEVFIAPRELLWQLYAKGALSPVVQYLSDAYPATLAQFRFNNKLYAQPWLTDVPLLFYRTDGAAMPTGLSDLFSKGQVALATLNTQCLAPWWSSQGGILWANNAPQLNSAANLAFLQQLLSWRDAKQLQVGPNALNLFANNQVPYTIAWASQIPFLTQLKVPWQAMALTALVGGQGRLLPGPTLGIANSAVQTQGAMVEPVRVVEGALLSSGVESALAQAGHRSPVSTGYYQGQNAQGVGLLVSQFLQNVWPLAGDAPEWKLIPLQDTAWNQAFSAGMSPQDALNNAQSQAGKVLSSTGG